MTVLEDIVFQEGRPANEEVVTIRNEYPISNGFAVFPQIAGFLERRVFEDFFHYGNKGRTIITNCVISRDDIAIALQKPHSPVEFIITFYVADVFTLIASIQVTIRVTDIDNNVPVFVGYETVPLHFTVPDMGYNDFFLIPTATDNDEGMNTVQNYTLLDTFDGLFSLETRTDDEGFILAIKLLQNDLLDRETRDQYTLRVRATEGNTSPDSAILTVNITVYAVPDLPLPTVTPTTTVTGIYHY